MQEVQRKKVQTGRAAITEPWVNTELPASFKELKYRLEMQRRRLQVLATELNQRVRSSLAPPTLSG
ncbi:MAG: hypothetical protein R6V07_19045 [Armatimonadota bacterium]